MITKSGYSKDPSIIPEAIAITFGKDMIKDHGGLLKFLRNFESSMVDEDHLWLQKCRNKPAYDNISYVYIIVCNRVLYRGIFGGWSKGQARIERLGMIETVDWRFISIAGPIVKAPHKIVRRGFQGFRYSEKLF